MCQIYRILFVLFTGIIRYTCGVDVDQTVSIGHIINETLYSFSISYQTISSGPLKISNPFYFSRYYGPDKLSMLGKIENPEIIQESTLTRPLNRTFCHFPSKYLMIDIPENSQNVILSSEIRLVGQVTNIKDIGNYILKLTKMYFITEEPPMINTTVLQMGYDYIEGQLPNKLKNDQTFYRFLLPWESSLESTVKNVIINQYFSEQLNVDNSYQKMRSLCLQYEHQFIDGLYVIHQDLQSVFGPQKYKISIKGLTDFDELYIFLKRNDNCKIMSNVLEVNDDFYNGVGFLKTCVVLYTRPLQGSIECYYKNQKGEIEQKVFKFKSKALCINHIIHRDDKQSQIWNLLKVDISMELFEIENFVEEKSFNVSQQTLVSDVTRIIIQSLQRSLKGEIKL